jgi:uncharacterized protein YjbJ (UPF0337 family)
MYATAQSVDFPGNRIRLLGEGERGRIGMNLDRLLGTWQQLRGKMKERWGTLTGDPYVLAAGARDRLLGEIQEQRGASKEEADRQLRDFMKRYRDWSDLSR